MWNERRAMRADWLKKLPSRQYITWDYSTNGRPEQVGRPVYYTKQISRDLKELKGTRLSNGKTERAVFSPTGKDDFHVPAKFAKLWGR